MNIFRRFNKKGWTFEFGYDEAYQFESLLKGELKYKENICNLSEKNFSNYINDKNTIEDFRGLTKKTVLLVNGEIRNSEKFREISQFLTLIEDSEGNPIIEYLPHFMSISADSKK